MRAFIRLFLSCVVIVVGATRCSHLRESQSFLETVNPVISCPESSLLESIDSHDILIDLSPQVQVYEQKKDNTWEKICTNPENLHKTTKDKKIILSTSKNTLLAHLWEYDNLMPYQKASFLCRTDEKYGVLHYSGPPLSNKRNYAGSMVPMIFDFDSNKDIQKSMRELAAMKRHALYPDGTCFLFWLEPRDKSNNFWKINGVEISKQDLTKQLQDFEQWRKNNSMPPVLCTIGMKDGATVQEAVNAITWLYQCGAARVDLGQSDEIDK